MISNRLRISPIWLSVLVAAFIMAAFNRTFWETGYRIFEGNLLHLLVFGAAVFTLTLSVVSLASSRWLQKPALILLINLGASSSYYMDTLGVVLDREMIQNIMTTTITESKHLITLSLVQHILVFGILPSLLVLWVRIERPAFLRALWSQSLLVAVSVAMCFALLLSNLKTYSVVLRSNKELMGSYQPGAPIAGTINYFSMILNSREIVLTPIGEDARKGPLLSAAPRPVLTIVITGETVRAQNFGLNGYARNTTPELAARTDLIAYQDVSSCGTATAVSLPCMFSRFDRDNYSYEKGIGNENLLDVLSHAGVKVEWWDNNTGDKNIAARVFSQQLTYLENPEFCAHGECNDGIFLDLLAQKIETITEDTVLVLHQIGSHGPAYYLRYPKAFERFTPTCDSSELKNCSNEQIANTYDNTIVYTDHILAQTITMLEQQDKVIPAMLYVSDHGESLGENGLYLHGAPYFMAPEEQTKVPMVLWLSEAYKSALPVDTKCLSDQENTPASHANLFHSVLGLMDIVTVESDPALDLISMCRTAEGTTHDGL